MKIGVLCLQGAVREHVAALEKCGVEVACVKKKEHFADLDGLIIPGGESTTIGKLIDRYDLASSIQGLIEQGKPVYGTCAGMILLARKVEGSDQFLLGQMDICVERNAFGRQRESFEADLPIACLGDEPFRTVFIRAPLITQYGKDVEILATCDDRVVAARQGNILVSSFHPELTDDHRMHLYFVKMAK
ncbi:pyridoxal 5'-phosphate synthase glutaminase subunit PdxT [Dethiobacter alkaliphilus]|uniref:Pyridoxal 5'-phosphate synthase subunit PdxT n=1 Tax=Dethiobacter alkaliphilus AHT 1 TaxID=555088 RepID=C0GI51_DETAL|nr:pyridoxal 5'-phosphate synthase glutaminase subunit PdxT [Dethiobacter alkaliphilus]EEG76899.1 SNO glutamine amidotransferase [Dethiobacter alkaliphilus AHT 1]